MMRTLRHKLSSAARLLSRKLSGSPARKSAPRKSRLGLETLEDRLVLSATLPPVAPTAIPGLVDWYQGQGNTLDATGKNNATAVGGVSYAPGVVGQAFNFDGSTGYLQTPANSTTLNFNDAITISAWVDPSTYKNDNVIIDKTQTGDAADYRFGIHGNQLFFYNGSTAVFSNAAIPLNTFTQAALTLDGSTNTLKFYINGQLDSTYKIGFGNANAAAPTIGRDIEGRSFQGEIDEISIFHGALNAGQVQSLYSAPTTSAANSQPIPGPTPAGATAPFQNATVNLGAFLSSDAASHTLVGAQNVSLAALEQTTIDNHSWNPQGSDYYAVTLKQGQIFTASSQAEQDYLQGATWAEAGVNSTLSLLDANGNVLIQNVSTSGGAAAFAYQVAADGTYYVRVDGAGDPAAPNYRDVLNLRPIGLDNTQFDPTQLSQDGGGLFVFENGQTLDFAGSTGHGFGIRGNWTQTINGTGSTYTASGAIYLETALGEVPISLLPGTSLSVSSQNDQFNHTFGELETASLQADFLGALAGDFGAGTAFGIDASTTGSPVSYGIALGSALGDTGAPVFANIPYLYAKLGGGSTSFSFGGISVSPHSDVPNPTISVVADPADPYLFLGADGLPGPVPKFGVAGSVHGLIPFSPTSPLDRLDHTVTGNIYVDGALDLTDVIDVPVTVEGAVVLNFDANHTGQVFGGAFSNASDFINELTHPSATLGTDVVNRLETAAKDVIFAIDGSATTSLTKYGLDFSIPLGNGAFVYDGPDQQLFLHGESTPIDLFQGTPLEGKIKLGDGAETVDAFVDLNTKEFQVDVNLDDYNLIHFDYNGSTEQIELNAETDHLDPLDNSPVAPLFHFTTQVVTLDATANLSSGAYDIKIGAASFSLIYQASASLDVNNNGIDINGVFTTPVGAAHLVGHVDYNGNFTLTGDAQVNLGIVGGDAQFSLADQGGVVTASAHLHAYLNLGFVSEYVDATATIQPGETDLSLSGSGLGNFYLGGRFWGNGTFEVSGWGSLTIGPISGSAYFDWKNYGYGNSLDTYLYADLNLDIINVGVSASLHSQQNSWGGYNTSFYASGGPLYLSGSIDAYGNFDFQGGASLNFAGQSAYASFDLNRTWGSVRYTSQLDVHYNFWVFQGDVYASLNLWAAPNGSVTSFSGSAYATVDIYAPQDGWQFWNWNWQQVASVGVSINTNDLYFYVNVFGFQTGIDIPV